MSDSKSHNQQRDYFSQYIQQQLRGHQLPPDEDCWGEIEQQLKRRQIGLLISRGLYLAGAAILALLLWMNIPTKEEIPFLQPEIETIEAIEKFAINEVKTEKPTTNRVVAKAFVKPVVKTIPETKPEAKTEPEPEAIAEPEPPKEKETPKDEPAATRKKTALPILPDTQTALTNKTKRKGSWQIGAGFTTMGSNFLQNAEEPTYSDNISNEHGGGGYIPSVPGYGNAILQPDDFNDISYNLPLSFGITVRKDLGKRMAVETGLIYTYLSTNLSKNGSARVKGKLGLHYLGIPVNLIADLWDSSKWNVYASAGVMLEKGLRSIYTQHSYRTGTKEETTMRTSIHGLQWSMNGALGISYRLLKDWSLYAEPRVSYFFDNNQPISARTDKPLTLGFGLGIRLDF